MRNSTIAYVLLFAFVSEAVAGQGNLVVRSNVSDADIFIDGTFFGKTDASQPKLISVSAGNHIVKGKKQYYMDTQEEQILVEEGQYKEVNLSFATSGEIREIEDSRIGAKRALGKLSVGTIPDFGTNVQIAGQSVDNSFQAPKTFELSAGWYQIHFSYNGAKYDTAFEVIAGRNNSIIFNWNQYFQAKAVQSTGYIRIDTAPSQASLTINNSSCQSGRSYPFAANNSVTVKITASGYQTWQQSVSIRSQQTAYITGTLLYNEGSFSCPKIAPPQYRQVRYSESTNPIFTWSLIGCGVSGAISIGTMIANKWNIASPSLAVCLGTMTIAGICVNWNLTKKRVPFPEDLSYNNSLEQQYKQGQEQSDRECEKQKDQLSAQNRQNNSGRGIRIDYQ